MDMIDTSRPGRNPRMPFFFGLIGLLFGILMVGLAIRQLLQQDRYLEKEQIQAQRRILHPGPRGEIYDRNGRLLAGNRPRFSAVIYPDGLARLRNEGAFYREFARRREAVYAATEAADEEPDINLSDLIWESRRAVIQRHLDQLNSITGRDEQLSRSALERHFTRELLMPLTLVEDLEPEEYARLIEQLPVESPIQIYTDTARYYPFGPVAAHILGYTSSKIIEPDTAPVPGEDLTTFSFKTQVGMTGLERSFNDRIGGVPGGEITIVDPSGYQYEEGLVARKIPEKGDNLVTSIDIAMQVAAENGLTGKTGAAVAIDVLTGEVLVLASHPDYDPNRLSPYIPRDVYREINEKGAWLNRATQGLYPPGSTFKLITALAALREGVVTPDTIVDSPKYLRVGNRLFPCHSDNGFGPIDLAKALSVSANVYFYKVGIAAGIGPIAREAKAFGLDTRTSLELPFNSGRMIVPDKAWKRENRPSQGSWTDGDTANVSIGQGFLRTTPMHMALFTASLARGETRTRPTLRKQPEPESGRAGIDHGGTPIGLPGDSLAGIYEGMRKAVREGTARLAQLPTVNVGGKTGTAQVRSKGQDLTLAWFVGMAPMEDPRVAVCVVVEGTDPAESLGGGTTAAPVARAMLDAYFKPRQDISPTLAQSR
ncbi:MAG: penicillin-binding transpeptidase domain-containing protein [Opitutales bacterium]